MLPPIFISIDGSIFHSCNLIGIAPYISLICNMNAVNLFEVVHERLNILLARLPFVTVEVVDKLAVEKNTEFGLFAARFEGHHYDFVCLSLDFYILFIDDKSAALYGLRDYFKRLPAHLFVHNLL